MTSQLPGREAGRTIVDREISYGGVPLEYHAGGAVMNASKAIDGGNTGYTYEIRAGWPLGRITATGLLVPCKRTQVNQSGATGTAFIVDNAAAFRVGDTISVGADTGKVISAIDYTTNTITVGGSFTFADNEAVVAEDGSQTCIGFLGEFLRLRNADNTADQNQAVSKLVVGGVVNQSYLLGDITAILADTTSAAAMRGRLKVFNPTTNSYTL